MIISSEQLSATPKLTHDGYTLLDDVYFIQNGINIVGVLCGTDSQNGTFEVAVKLEDYDMYVVIDQINEIHAIDPVLTRPQVFQAITNSIARIFSSQMEIYGDATLQNLELDSLDLMDVISRVEVDLARDIDISRISLSHTVDELTDIIYNSQLVSEL